jgi:hypothetical protein
VGLEPHEIELYGPYNEIHRPTLYRAGVRQTSPGALTMP